MIKRLVAAVRVAGMAARDLAKGRRPHLRSHLWPKVRRLHLHAFPTCAGCGTWEKLEVHHVKSFHEHPELELDPRNFITLCETKLERCHFELGHLKNWKGSNPNVWRDAAARLKARQWGRPTGIAV